MATVELEEFNEQNTDVDVRTADIFPVVKLENNTEQLDVKLPQMLPTVDQFLTGFLICHVTYTW